MRCKKYRKYLRLYWRNAQITANICANICGEKSENIRTANICAIIYDNIGATLQIPHILAKIFAAKKSENIRTANICAIIYGEKSKKKPMAPYLGEGVKKENFFLGLCPKLWVGGGQKS